MKFGKGKPNKLNKNGEHIYNVKSVEDIKRGLINCGFNSSLVYEMTDKELLATERIHDIEELNNYMDCMAIKYDI